MNDAGAILAVKRAANLLFNLSQRDGPITADERAQMAQASDALDVVTRSLGGNPYTPAFGPGL